VSTKLLWGLAVALGLVLLAVWMIPDRSPGPADVTGAAESEGPAEQVEAVAEDEPAAEAEELDGELIDSGRFVLKADDTVLIEEGYMIFYHPVDGYMLVSQGTLTIQGQVIGLSEQTQYDHQLRPYAYTLSADTASGTQIISATTRAGGMTLSARAGDASQSREIDDAADLYLIDNNIVSHLVMLYRALRAEGLPDDFQVAVPQALLVVPSSIHDPVDVSFRSGGDIYNGLLTTVYLGDTAIDLIAYQDRLIGLVNRTQGTVAYDVSQFPQGLEILEEPTASEEGGLGTTRTVTFANGTLALVGTLELPRDVPSPYPAVLFVHGSGAVDRDGNAAGFEMDAYRQLAVALAESGIASFRFDKRGTGESGGDLSMASRDDLVEDLQYALETLRRQREVDAERIVLVGHSEGGYLAPILASEDETIAGLVLIAAAATSLDEVTLWQIETVLRAQGASQEQVELALEQEHEYFAFVKSSVGEWADYTVADLQTAMPWLTDEAAQGLASTGLSLSWLRQHYTADPAAVLAQVSCPVLVIHGDKDSQVPVEEAERIREVLENAGNVDGTVRVLSDLNHLLRYHPEEPSLIARHLDDAIDPRVIDALATWFRETIVR